MIPSMRQWAEENAEPAKVPKPTPAPVVRTPIDENERKAIAQLQGVVFFPGTATKRFAENIHSAEAMTDKQRAFLWSTVWRFRRQIPDADLVRIAGEKTGKKGFDHD